MNEENRSGLSHLIPKRSRTVKDPADREVRILEDQQAEKLAEDCHCSVYDVYIEALTQGIYPYRYIRNMEIISPQEQLLLAKSRVAVIGAGGLGGHVILLLARLGIGNLVVADPDVFDETNLNRQVLSSVQTLGRSKSEEAVQVVGAVNPGIIVSSFQTRLMETNAFEILTGADVVVDALDNLPDRLILEKSANELGIPLIHGALAGFEGQLMTIFPDDPGLKNLYGSIKLMKDKSKSAESVLGVPGITPSLIATLQAMEVFKVLLNRGKAFQNTMVHLDLEHGAMNRFEIKK